MKKIFASDFDGTLYFNKREIKLPQESVRAIKQFQEAGHLFGLCTGRPVGAITPFIGDAVSPDFYICSSGTKIMDGSLNVIRQTQIDRKSVENICRDYLDQGCRIMICVEETYCVFQEMDIPVNLLVLKGVEELPEGAIYQVSIHAETSEEASKVAARINEIYGDKVTAFQNVSDIDLTPRGCSKGKGMEVIRRYFEEKYGDVTLYGIGDSYNDLPLIEAADRSYTFPYAPVQVQGKASKVVETIADAIVDAIAEAMEDTGEDA